MVYPVVSVPQLATFEPASETTKTGHLRWRSMARCSFMDASLFRFRTSSSSQTFSDSSRSQIAGMGRSNFSPPVGCHASISIFSRCNGFFHSSSTVARRAILNPLGRALSIDKHCSTRTSKSENEPLRLFAVPFSWAVLRSNTNWSIPLTICRAVSRSLPMSISTTGICWLLGFITADTSFGNLGKYGAAGEVIRLIGWPP